MQRSSLHPGLWRHLFDVDAYSYFELSNFPLLVSTGFFFKYKKMQPTANNINQVLQVRAIIQAIQTTTTSEHSITHISSKPGPGRHHRQSTSTLFTVDTPCSTLPKRRKTSEISRKTRPHGGILTSQATWIKDSYESTAVINKKYNFSFKHPPNLMAFFKKK